MNDGWYSGFKPHSFILLLFGAGALWFMFSTLRGGAHPLGLEPDPALCEILDTSVWATLPWSEAGGVIRIPTASANSRNQCALELDPVPAGDRFARIERSEDADRVREIATVMVITRAALYRQNPKLTTSDFADGWSAELHADGWQGEMTAGPWQRGELFIGRDGRQGLLIEDDGIMIWITASELTKDNLLLFAGDLATNLRRPR